MDSVGLPGYLKDISGCCFKEGHSCFGRLGFRVYGLGFKGKPLHPPQNKQKAPRVSGVNVRAFIAIRPRAFGSTAGCGMASAGLSNGRAVQVDVSQAQNVLDFLVDEDKMDNALWNSCG